MRIIHRFGKALAAVALFFVLQLMVYVFCLIRLSIIKRVKAPAKLKLKLLENEENLFDLGQPFRHTRYQCHRLYRRNIRRTQFHIGTKEDARQRFDLTTPLALT